METKQITIDRILKADVTQVTISKNESPGFETMEFPKDFDNKKVIEEVGKKYDLNSYVIKERQEDNSSRAILEDIAITRDNVHLYYNEMSEKDISLNLSAILDSRIFKVSERIKIDFKFLAKYSTNDSIFGVKDTLKPTDEYVTEIKDSEAYKAYISLNSKNGLKEEVNPVLEFLAEAEAGVLAKRVEAEADSDIGMK
jgi:hypothetical protein